MGHLFNSVSGQPGGLRAWRCLGPGAWGQGFLIQRCGLCGRAGHGSERPSPIVLLVGRPAQEAGRKQGRLWAKGLAEQPGSRAGPGRWSGQCRGEAGGGGGAAGAGWTIGSDRPALSKGFFLMFLFGCCSVARLCPARCNPIDCSMPGCPVLYHLPELAQTHVRWFVMPSNHLILCCPLLFLPSVFPRMPWFPSSLSQHTPFPGSWLFTLGCQSIGASASASVLPVNTQGWFLLQWNGLIFLQSKGLSRVFSSTTIGKRHSVVLRLLYGPTLESLKVKSESESCSVLSSYDY